MGDTSHYRSLNELTSAQLVALGALTAGSTHEEAAEAAGVHRVTVTRWTNHHPAFIAAMNRVRTDIARKTRTKVHRPTELALDVVEAALEGGDREMALRWLRMHPPSGLVDQPGPTDSAEVVEEIRSRMRSSLDEMLASGNQRTTAEAECAIARRLAEHG